MGTDVALRSSLPWGGLAGGTERCSGWAFHTQGCRFGASQPAFLTWVPWGKPGSRRWPLRSQQLLGEPSHAFVFVVNGAKMSYCLNARIAVRSMDVAGTAFNSLRCSCCLNSMQPSGVQEVLEGLPGGGQGQTQPLVLLGLQGGCGSAWERCSWHSKGSSCVRVAVCTTTAMLFGGLWASCCCSILLCALQEALSACWAGDWLVRNGQWQTHGDE